MSTSPDPLAGCNLVVLLGVASRTAQIRTMPSGRRLATLALRVPGVDGRATSVPVAAWEPPPWLEGVGPDDALVVVGTMQRRFFRDGAGRTSSRVEVQAVSVGRAHERRRREAAARRALRTLGELE